MKCGRVFFFAIAAIFAGAASAPAQAPIEPAQLPARTLFYVLWRGAPAPAARQANSLLALWDDPDFAPVRSAIVEGILSERDKADAKKSSGSPQATEKMMFPVPAMDQKTRLTRQEIEEFATLLDNPFMLGYFSEPEGHAASAKSSPAGKAAHAWNGGFLLYNRAGKEALLTKAVARLRQEEKEPAQITPVMIAGVAALKIEHKTGASYWAETGKFAIGASEKSVFEEILKSVGEKSPAAVEATLGGSAAFREAQPMLGAGNVLEFFFRVPDVKKLAGDTSASGIRVAPLLDTLHLDSLHSVVGSLTLEGARTRFQGAVLGDTAEGTVFDIWAGGSATPASAALAPADTVYYSETQIDLPAILATVRRAARSLSPAGQSGIADVVENSIQTRIGMPLDDALALFTGEITSVQTSSNFDPAHYVVSIGIRKKPETLKLLRTMLSEKISSERAEGDTTFFKISLSGSQGSTGVAQWNFYHLAVTPEMIVGASRAEILREALARRAQTASSGGLFAQPKFQESRGRFPEKLNGLGYLDFQRVNWQAIKDRWIAEAKKAGVNEKSGAGANKTGAAMPAWLEQLDPAIFSRHLHTLSSGSWKDATGFRFDAWLE